jgi:ribonucleotide reductase alpha subunit
MELTLETIKEKTMATYTREEVLKSALEYFKGDELASTVWVNKYALKDSDGNLYERTPADMHDRISDEIYRIEKKYKNPMSRELIYSLIDGFKYIIPQGSPMSGIGNNFQTVSLSNCFVIGESGPSDSYGAILKLDQEQVQLMKRRGGVGHTLEAIRPKGSRVNNSALTSTGVVPFMERYSNSTREVAQDGRRGALMLSMSIKHPDSEAFIDAKLDGTKVTGANVSIKAHDDFMKAVTGDGKYIQQWPVDSNDPTITKEVDAHRIWNKVIANNWKSAEPGVLFWDQIIRESLPDRYADLGYKTVSTNPCIIGSTLIATADGRNAVSIEQLTKEGKDVQLYSTDTNTGQIQIKTGRNPRKTGANKEVWKLTLDDGSQLIATPDHKILTKDLEYVNLKDLTPGQSISPFNSFESNKYRQIANIGAKMSGGRFANRRQYREIYRFNNGDIDSKKYAIHHADFNNKNDSNDNLEKMLHEDHRRLHADLIMGSNNPYHKMTDEQKFNFASHPGESNPKYSGFTNSEILDHGKILFDKEGKITKRLWMVYAKEHKLPQDLANDFRFGNFSNFKNQVASNHKVISVEFHGYDDVYNITVDDNHNYNVITSNEDDNFVTSSGITIKNCGEIPLCPDDSCRLLAVNLLSYVTDPFTPQAKFDFVKFKEHANYALRMMDDIVDLEVEKINGILNKLKSDPEAQTTKRVEIELWTRIQKKCKEGRRTGVGITAEGDMLAALGLRYGTTKATDFAEEVHKTYALEVFRSSCELAKERGAFTIWDPTREQDHPFLNRIKEADPKLYADLMKYGRRNIALLTIAPTGTVSLMAQTSSGVENVFLVAYRRRKKVNPNDEGTSAVFVDDVGDHWEEYNVYHHAFKTWIEITGHKFLSDEDKNTPLEELSDETVTMLVTKSPYYKATSDAVDWVEKVRMQGRIQKWVDHSISVTVNLPEDATEEMVNKVYVTAWKEGCKGCTIYRDGSRSGVLISKEEKVKEELFKESNAPKRPKELQCAVMSFQNKGEKWVGLIGLLNDRPYEIFTGAHENFPIPSYVEIGSIRRTKGEDGLSNYDFLYQDKLGNDVTIPSLNHAFDDKFYDLAKTFSAILRHGMPIPYVVDLIDGLNLDGDLITTWKAGVKRMLKKFVKDGTTQSGKTCNECGSESLEYKEGCLTCMSCGNSKCGS